MRWDELFADLEATAAGWEQLGLRSEIADRTRAERAQIALIGRLCAARGRRVECVVAGTGRVAGTLSAVGADWLLLGEPEESLVLTAAVTAWVDLGSDAVDPAAVGEVERRWPLQSVLRTIVRDRGVVHVVGVDGTVSTGRLERVGADHLDVARYPLDAAGRSRDVQQRLTMPLGAIAVVRRAQRTWT